VSGTTINGCTGNDTVNITIHPAPLITISNDTVICRDSTVQLYVSGGQSYSWTPSATLNNPNIATPIASPASNTLYFVTITDNNTCQHLDSVQVNIHPDPVFTINNPVEICLNESASLQAGGGDSYLWQPSSGLDYNNISNPIAFSVSTTVYSVTITENTCNQSQTLSTTVSVNPLPQVIAFKSNDIDCTNDWAQLNATGALQYIWTPASFLNNPTIMNPVATPTATTVYTVRGIDAKGCSDTASINVAVVVGNKGGYFMPSAFTPNNDGLNDCYRVSHWGIIQSLEFSIYNRWGQLVFFSRDPSKCWDGTFKGKPQNPGVFVYMVKANTSCESNVFRKGTFVLIR
jgi:gliding motility-associated-like protein